MPVENQSDAVQSYVLRCWREDSEGAQRVVWRFALISAETRKRVGFATLPALVAWLDQQTQGPAMTAQRKNEER